MSENPNHLSESELAEILGEGFFETELAEHSEPPATHVAAGATPGEGEPPIESAFTEAPAAEATELIGTEGLEVDPGTGEILGEAQAQPEPEPAGQPEPIPAEEQPVAPEPVTAPASEPQPAESGEGEPVETEAEGEPELSESELAEQALRELAGMGEEVTTEQEVEVVAQNPQQQPEQELEPENVTPEIVNPGTENGAGEGECPAGEQGQGGEKEEQPEQQQTQPEEKPKKKDEGTFVVVRCTPEEKRKLDALSKVNGMVRSDLIKAQWHGLDGWEEA